MRNDIARFKYMGGGLGILLGVCDEGMRTDHEGLCCRERCMRNLCMRTNNYPTNFKIEVADDIVYNGFGGLIGG